MNLDIKDGAIQIEGSANGVFGGVVGKTPNIYGAIVVHRHFLFLFFCNRSYLTLHFNSSASNFELHHFALHSPHPILRSFHPFGCIRNLQLFRLLNINELV